MMAGLSIAWPITEPVRVVRYLLIFFCFSPIVVLAQQPSKDFGFVKYLLDKELFDEAAFVLKGILTTDVTQTQIDSAHFFLGHLYFRQKLLTQSVTHFDRVGYSMFSLKNEALFYGMLGNSYLGNFNPAKQKLLEIETSASDLNELKLLELAAINLLDNQFKSFDSLMSKANRNHYLFESHYENLEFHKDKLFRSAKKNGLTAGVLSALIPGAGSIYVEKTGQGIYQFVITALLGLQTWEGYRKDGSESARFIIFGALFSSYYISNIWGSVLGVKIYKNEINKTVDNAILLDMHIPIRTLFR